MSEAAAPSGAPPTDPDPARGRVPRCRRCRHVHRVTLYEVLDDRAGTPRSVTFDACCGECGCTASGRAYDTGLALTGFELVARARARDHDDDCPASGPRCLPGPGDAPRARPVDARGGLRRGRLGGLVWAGVSRLLGDLGGQLVGERRDVGRVRGRPDHRGDADPDRSAGPARVRTVVTPSTRQCVAAVVEGFRL